MVACDCSLGMDAVRIEAEKCALSFKLAHPQVSKHEGLKPALNGPHFSPTGDETGILSDLTTLGAFERLSQIEVYTP
jgi:hypothetical protein